MTTYKITNLLSAIPYVGTEVVQWVWGGFAVDNATLIRFFALHFLIPFVIAAIVLIHLLFLHQTGSNNPLGLNKNTDKIPFHPYFTVRDIVGLLYNVSKVYYLEIATKKTKVPKNKDYYKRWNNTTG